MPSKNQPVNLILFHVCRVWSEKNGAACPFLAPAISLLLTKAYKSLPTVQKTVLTRKLGKATHPETSTIQVRGLFQQERSQVGPGGGEWSVIDPKCTLVNVLQVLQVRAGFLENSTVEKPIYRAHPRRSAWEGHTPLSILCLWKRSLTL